MPRAMWRIFTRLWLATFGLLAVSAQAGTTDGDLRMEVTTAYNLVVDSNIESPAGKSPSAAHMGVKIYNDGATALTNVVVNIGNFNPLTSTGTPGVFESRVNPQGYTGTFALEAPGGVADCTRIIPSIGPGEYAVQYFFAEYPLKDDDGDSVAGAANVTTDDLWLNYDIWATAGAFQVDKTTTVTMRNEISAMANKIWPNTDSKVPDKYLTAIEATLGWRPEAGNTRVPGAVVMEGIWYDLGNVGAGFDNDGDGLPDRNAWMQPVGDPTKFSPLAARLVKCYGIVIVKLNDGTEQLIPFEDRLYFENLPANNTGAVGLVYYEFLPLDLSKPSLLSPYQEVASGYDNEKFNADYGASVGSVTDNLVTENPTADIQKTGPTAIAIHPVTGANADYTITATNTGTVQFGWPDLGVPVVIEDAIPTGLEYVSGSAVSTQNVTTPVGGLFTVFYSTDSGSTWTNGEPVPASDVNRLRWVLDRPLAPTDTATVKFSATVPTGYASVNFTNTAFLKLGTENEIDRDEWPTNVLGNNSLGNFVWRDLDRDGVQDGGTETGISGIGVSLYIDTDGDDILDSGEPLYGTTTTDTNGEYLFSNLPDRNYIAVVNAADAISSGFTLKAGVSDRFVVNLNSAGDINFLTADWPFIKALEVTKTVTPTTYFGGELITYDIHLDNHMNTLQLPSPNVQTVYASLTAFTGNAAASATQGQAALAPDSNFTSIDFQAGSDELETSGITDTFPNVGNITKVELILRGYMSQNSTNNSLAIHVRHSGAAIANNAVPFTTLGSAALNSLVGVSQDYVVDITSYVTGGPWSNPQVNSLRAQLRGKKTGNGDPGDYFIDSIGFRVTTDNTPFAGSSGDNTISQWPLVDTFDPAKLEFVSASITPDITTPAGTIVWHNLGPVNAGARKSIAVTFRAQTPTDTTIPADGKRDPITAINTVNTIGDPNGFIPRFQTGLPAGHDDGSATVTINPAGRIGDFVYWDVDNGGAYNSGDLPISGVLVQLYLGGVYTGRSQFTDQNGYYEFTGLADGTYDVRVTTDTASDLFTLPWTTFTSSQKGTAGTNQTGYVQGDSVVINNTDFLTTNDSNLLQDFGFDSNTASLISGTLFRDWDGDGVQDPGDEPLVGYTITLSGGTSLTVTTDSNGYYQFENITSTASHTVTVTSPPASHTQTLDPDATVNSATTINPVALGTAYINKNFAYRPTGTLTLGDTLYYDWNGDGDQDLGEGGIPNVSVHLHEDANGDGVVNGTDALIANITTDSNGFYQFTLLAAGNYIVMVDESDPDFPTDHTQTQDYDLIKDDKAKVNLSANLDTVDFGYLPTGTASIGNLVWLDADNDGIKDTSESGINGVIVELYHSSQTPGTHTPAATTTTSGGGFYLFENLAIDEYYVYIPVTNFGSGQPLVNIPLSSTATATTDNQVDNDDNGIQSAISTAVTSPLITLSAAETDITVDFGFTGVGSVGDFVFYDVNGNGGQDYNEVGIAGVTVKIFLGNDATGTLIDTAITSDGTDPIPANITPVGYYRFDNLPPGTYFVQVDTSSLPSGLTQTADPDRDGVPVGTAPLTPPGDHADSSVIVTSGSSYSGADFGYQQPGSIGDFVWLDVDRDGVQDFGEPGIEGVTVRITNVATPATYYDVVTDYDGLWAKAVADGSWTVSILSVPSGYASTYDADSGTTSPNASVAVTIASGLVTVPGVGNLGLDFGLALNGAYSLSGTIAINDSGVIGKHSDIDDFIDDGVDMDAGANDETELSGVIVYLYSGSTPLGSTVTDANGNYSFTGLPNGSYKVIIGTTDVPLDRSVLTTTTANAGGATVTVFPIAPSTATSVTQAVTISGTNIQDIDFMFDSTVNFDFGDLPLSYDMTTLSQDGARHIIPGGGSTIWLGTAPDAEINGIPNATANGDDLIGSDDENGVVAYNIGSWIDGVNGGSIRVTIPNGITGYLVGWIDFNHNDSLIDVHQDSGISENIISQSITGTGSAQTITFDIPPGTILSGLQSWLSRFRLFKSPPAFPLFSYVGEAIDGEIEDHIFEKTAGSSIGDMVWVNTNGNSVIDGTEVGLGGVVVQLRASDNVTVLATQTTSNGSQDVDGDGVIDPVGYYRFTGIIPPSSPTTYNVVILTEPVGYDANYDGDGGTLNTIAVALDVNEQHITADFGYAPLTAKLSGTVYFDTVTPGVISGGDAAAPSVRVQLFTDPNGDGDPSDGVQVSETFTNTLGFYEFLAVPSGKYVVVEVNPPGANSVLDVAVSASVPISTATDDRIPVTMEGTNVTGRNFLDTQPYSIAGTVYDDSAVNNNVIDDGVDTRVAGVTVNLYIDRDGNGLFSVGDTLSATTTTNSTGDYTFSGLVPGDYVVEKINPAGGSVVNDWDAQAPLNDSQIGVEIVAANIVGRNFLIDGYHVSIGDFTWVDADKDGQQDGVEIGFDGVTVTLYRPGFGPDGIAGNSDDTTAVATTTTAGGGAYSFAGLPPGTYQVNFNTPARYGRSPSDQGADATDSDAGLGDGNTANIVLAAGDSNTTIDAGYYTCPDDWTAWKAMHPSEGLTGSPAANTDADNYDNLAEFAFHMPYDSGIGSVHLDHTAWIVRESTLAPGTVEGVFVRPTGAYLNVVYTLQYAAVIGSPTTTWSTLVINTGLGGNATVVNNGDCTETVTIHDLATHTGLTAGTGVVRIKADLDDDGLANGGSLNHTTYTETEGWKITNFAVCCQSYNNPYARESVFTGTISAVSAQQISFTNELLLGSVLEVGASYYIEVETGTHEGHRYDVASTGAGSLTLVSDNDLYAATAPFNTTTTAPPVTLVGAKIALRRHWKLAEMFPPLDHVATGSQATADQVQIFVQGAWKIYWLYNQNDVDPNTAIWVDAADGGMADQAAVIIPPGQGMLFNNRGAARTQLSYGEIRVNDFIRPLPIGRSLVGGGYPLDQYAANHADVPATAPGRQMTKAVGFFGSRDHTTADSFFLWNADTINQGRSYSTYFLHDATLTKPATPLIRWVVVGDNVIQIRDEEVLFKSDRAVFIRTINGLPVYTIPSPWAP